MIFNIIIVLVAILLENIFNIFLNIDILSPLFTLVSLIIIYKNFEKDRNKYFVFSFITGLTYDIFFTNFFILNSFIFFICSTIIFFIFSKFKYNILNVIFTSILIILIYNLSIYLILNFFRYTNYNLLEFVYILKDFFIINIIYISLVYLITKNTYFKNKI